MNNDVKVTVILPSLNVVSYIRECLDSVINQTLEEIEILCIDAGSTDGTLEILKEYEKNDKRVRVIVSSVKSYGKQINIGFDEAKGKYVGIVETDDYIEAEMYEKLYEAAERYNVDFVRSDFCRFYGEKENRTFQYVPLTYGKKEYERFYNKVVCPSDDLHIFNLLKNNVTGIYNTNFIRINNIRLNETPGASFQDNGLWFQSFIFAKRVYFLNEVYYRCRRDNENSSVKDKGKVWIIVDEYNFIYEILKNNPELYNLYIKAFWVGKFGSYNFNYTRVAEEYKYEFLEHFYKDYSKAIQCNEIDKDLFPIHHQRILEKILENHKKYYVDDLNKRFDSNRDEIITTIKKKIENKIANSNRAVKLSIIIPVYNSEEYLKQTLESAIEQTLKEIEIICVNDGSTDKSLLILYSYSVEDDRIIILNQENSGAGQARNKGIDFARGEYISFLDADDWYPDSNTLQKLYTNAKRENVLISGGGVVSFSGDRKITKFGESLKGNVFNKKGVMLYKEYQFDYSYQRFIYNRSMLVDNKIYFPLYRRFQDPPFFVKAMICAEKFYATTDVTYCYRYIPKSAIWDETRIEGLISGLIDNFKLSSENNLKELHKLTLYRCEHDFCDILSNLNSSSLNAINKLFVLNTSIDYKLIGLNKYIIITPLRNILRSLLKADLEKKDDVKKHLSMKELDDVIKEKNIIKTKELRLEKELNSIKNGWSFKIGRVITYIPRKVRGGIRCYKEHGLKFTIRRIIEKMIGR